MLNNSKEDKIFASILADGLIHITCDEFSDGAIKREYETSTGEKGVKYEHQYTDITGIITDVKFFEGDYGKSLQLTISDGDEKPVVLSLSTASSYGEDAMKKLLNVDLTQEVKIAPYSFTDENGKNKKGVTIYQNGAKIQNHFYNPETKENINGYPEPKKLKAGKKMDKELWKIYFAEVRVFLVDKITEHFKLDKDDIQF